MSEYLVVRLAGDPDRVTWVVLSEQGHRLNQTVTGSLTTAAHQAAHRKVLLLVPGLDAVTTRVTLPVKRQSRIEKMLPYTLEDSVAEDVDSLLFAAGPNRDDGEIPVAIVARDLIDAWLADCAAAGLTVDAIFVDAQGVPDNPGYLTLLLEDRKVYCRLPDDEAFVFEDIQLEELFEMLGTKADTGAALDNIVVYGDNAGCAHRDDELKELRERVATLDVNVLSDGLLPRLAATLITQPGCNLLQGPYRVKSDWAELARPWRTPGLLILALVIVAGVVQAGNNFRLSRQDQSLTSVLETSCQQAFAVNRLPACEAEIRQRLALTDATENTSNQRAFLDTLLAVARARDNQTVLQAMQFRDGASTLRVTAPDVPSLDRFAQSLGNGGQYRVEIQSANPGEDGVEGRLRIAEESP
jgi:general secretion pathway protein L